MTDMLSVNGLDHHYGSAQSLRGVSLQIGQGECLALLGRNGAGKTTLLRCLAGTLQPSAGQITLDAGEIARGQRFTQKIQQPAADRRSAPAVIPSTRRERSRRSGRSG